MRKCPAVSGQKLLCTPQNIRNIFICPRNGQKSSYELFTGQKPRVDHLLVFGSLSWIYIPREKRKKRDPKSADCVLIGCYENTTHKVVVRSKQAPDLARQVKRFGEFVPKLKVGIAMLTVT